MKMQNQLFYNEEDNSDLCQYISEECWYCKEELTKTEDIKVDNNDRYCCSDCNAYYKLNAKECKEI